MRGTGDCRASMSQQFEKLIKRFEDAFANANYYEAHQIVRTIYSRWLRAKNYDALAEFMLRRILEFAQGLSSFIRL